MKLKKIPAEAKDPTEGFVVEEISSDDIALPSEHFRKFVRELTGLSFLNLFTIDELTEQAKTRFASRER